MSDIRGGLTSGIRGQSNLPHILGTFIRFAPNMWRLDPPSNLPHILADFH